MDRPGNPAQWNISRLWPLPVKSLAQSLDYRANSYHIHLSILGFHGYGEEISQICPCPFCPINSSFSGASFYSPNSAFLAAALFEDSKNSSKKFLQQPSSFWSSSLRENGHQLHRAWGQFYFSLVFSLHPCSSAVHLTEYFFLFFALLFTPKNF